MKKVFILFVAMLLGFSTYTMAAEKNYDGPVGPPELNKWAESKMCEVVGEDKSYDVFFLTCTPEKESTITDVKVLVVSPPDARPIIFGYSYKDAGVLRSFIVDPSSSRYRELENAIPAFE